VQITQISAPNAPMLHLPSSVLKTIDGKLFLKLATRQHCIQRLLTSRCEGVQPRFAYKAIQKTTVVDELRKAKLAAVRGLVKGGSSTSGKAPKRFRFGSKQFEGRAMVLPNAMEVSYRSTT